MNMKKVLMVLMVMLPLAVFGQTASMLSLVQAELDRRGLTEAEVRSRLLQEGIDVDNIPPTEYAAYQSRVTDVINRLQREKATAAATDQNETLYGGTNAAGQTTIGAQVLYDPTEAALLAGADSMLLKNSTPEEVRAYLAVKARMDSLAALNDADKLKKDSIAYKDSIENQIWGHSLLKDKSLYMYRTIDGAQAPDNYVLGEGDEVHISIFGSSQTEIHQRIGADGSIQPAGSSKIFLKGLTLAQARSAIRSKLAAHYSFRQDQIAVTITTARTVAVSLYGEVDYQGGYTISALNTAFNAMAAAGGPTEIGSVRNIMLSRGGKSSRLDLYAYMMKPDPNVNYDIQNNDVLFVPVAQKIVKIQGAVNRPMRYEMIDGEGLKNLVEYAGGLSADANTDMVQVERTENGQKKYLEFDLAQVMKGSQKVDLYNGDIVRVRKSTKPMEDFVAIEGGVYYGGNYDLEGNSSLMGLIEKAQTKYTAKTDYVFVERTKPDETVEVLTIPYPGVNGNPDFKLQARDKVTVLELNEYSDRASITVAGEVRKPFTREFGLNDRMTVGQAIEYAGGLRPNGYNVAYIIRKDQTNRDKSEYIRVNLDKDLGVMLQPGDILTVYDNTTYTNIGEVSVSGAVKLPLHVDYDASLTVHDLLSMAGGFTVGAAYNRVEVFRVNISRNEPAKYDQITLEVDEDYNLVGRDFQLQPFDHIVVRMIPDFSTGRTVEVNGRVKYPGVYLLEDGKTQLWEIIKMAGGLLDDADPYASVFRTFNNRGRIGMDLDKAKSNKGKISADLILMDGDVININRQENTVIIREAGTRMGQYVAEDFAADQKIFVYQGKHNAAWYIRHYAGGFQKVANKNSVSVTMPNNQSEGTTRGLFGIRRYPTVQPGGVITVSIDREKQIKLDTPKEKINWNNSITQSVSTMTSVISLVILLKQIK